MDGIRAGVTLPGTTFVKNNRTDPVSLFSGHVLLDIYKNGVLNIDTILNVCPNCYYYTVYCVYKGLPLFIGFLELQYDLPPLCQFNNQNIQCLNIFSPNQILVFFENLNFYFMKTANIPVYGNIAVYIKQCTVCLTIFKLRGYVPCKIICRVQKQHNKVEHN